jgi:hypothetical protein
MNESTVANAVTERQVTSSNPSARTIVYIMLAGIASNDRKSKTTSSPVGAGHTARGDIKSVEIG